MSPYESLETSASSQETRHAAWDRAGSAAEDARRAASPVVRALMRWRPPNWALAGAFYVLLAAAAVIFVRTMLHGKNLHDMADALSTLGAPALARAGACVIGVYAMMCVMEALALRDARIAPLGPQAFAVPLMANAISMGTGFGALSGAGLRVRLYSRWRIDPGKALFVASSVTVMSISGGVFLAACGLVLSPDMIAPTLHIPPFFAQLAGGLILAAFLVGLGLAGDQPHLFKIAGHSFRAPRASGWAGRLGAGAADWVCSAATLYVLLPPHLPVGFLSFAALFATVHLASMATGLPGGIGAFDLIMLVVLRPDSIPIGAMAAALIAYRLIAFVLPIGLGAIGLAVFEAHNLGTRPRADHAGRGKTTARLVHWTTQQWARRLGYASPSAAPRTAATAHDLFSGARTRRRISLAALTRGGPILVIAPHPDDETLGCGGLLAACAARGIRTHVAILTDGANSHAGSRLWTRRRVAAQRAGETHAAIAKLGLSRRDLSLLNFGDGVLMFSGRQRSAAFHKVARLATRIGAKTVFVTWPHDPHPDHIAAAAIAVRLKARMPHIKIVHYPIWGRFLPGDVKIRDRNWRPVHLDVSAYRTAKRRALAAYRSQTTKLIDDARIAHRLTAKQTRAFMSADEIYLL